MIRARKEGSTPKKNVQWCDVEEKARQITNMFTSIVDTEKLSSLLEEFLSMMAPLRNLSVFPQDNISDIGDAKGREAGNPIDPYRIKFQDLANILNQGEFFQNMLDDEKRGSLQNHIRTWVEKCPDVAEKTVPDVYLLYSLITDEHLQAPQKGSSAVQYADMVLRQTKHYHDVDGDDLTRAAQNAVTLHKQILCRDSPEASFCQ